MKKISLIVLGLILIALGLLAYAFRPTPAPTNTIAEKTETVSGEKTIISEKSKARFEIYEVLRGSPFTVVGSTTNVSGKITFTPEGPKVSEIKINARALKTESEGRDRAINRFILKTDDVANEFIVFTPETVTGLPAEPKALESYTFTVEGNLKIASVTKKATFETTAKQLEDGSIEGSAKTTIKYKDFGLTIPEVSFVAEVADEVNLYFDFVAN